MAEGKREKYTVCPWCKGTMMYGDDHGPGVCVSADDEPESSGFPYGCIALVIVACLGALTAVLAFSLS